MTQTVQIRQCAPSGPCGAPWTSPDGQPYFLAAVENYTVGGRERAAERCALRRSRTGDGIPQHAGPPLLPRDTQRRLCRQLGLVRAANELAAGLWCRSLTCG